MAISGATADTYVLTAADKGFSVTVVVTAANAWGAETAQAAPTGPVAAAPPVNTGVPVIQSPSPVIQQGVTLTVGGATWNSHLRHDLPPLVGALQRRRVPADQRRHRHPVHAARRGRRLHARGRQHRHNIDGSVSARSAETVGGDADRRPALEDAADDLQQHRVASATR